MEIIKTIVWVVQIISAISIIILVLLQHGKGADAGATFGSGGGSGSLFGASGSSNFLSHTTAIFAVVFFCCTFGLVLLSGGGRVGDGGVMAGLNGKQVASSTAKAVNASATITNASQPAASTSAVNVTLAKAKSVTAKSGDKNQIPN